MGSLKEKAKALLQQCEVVTLTSINKEGYPRPATLFPSAGVHTF